MKLTERKCISGNDMKCLSKKHNLFSYNHNSIRYIYKLHDLHLQAENYTEAGFTLKLYADMLSWDKEILTFSPHDIAGQPEWLRKEKLYKDVKFGLCACLILVCLYVCLITDPKVFR